MSRVLTFIAGEEDEGRMVRDIIRDEFRLVAHDVARAKYRTENGITVDGVQVMVNRLMKQGEVLRVVLAGEEPGKIVPMKGPIEIIYEDEDLICLNKPAGLVVHPSHGHFADSIANFLAQYYLDCNDPHEVRTVGRLDKDTSGIIVYGKSRTICSLLTDQSADGIRRKFYIAAALGIFSENEGVIEAPISREYEEKIKRVVRDDGDYALTRYKVIRQYPTYAVVRVEIETGRTHQIRVHMAHIGHPLVGDPIYGDGGDPGRAALHAMKSVFIQPFTKECIELTAPIPEDMRDLVGDSINDTVFQ